MCRRRGTPGLVCSAVVSMAYNSARWWGTKGYLKRQKYKCNRN